MKITDWDKIKSLYIASEATLPALAQRFGVSVSTLKKRCARERWSDERAELNHRAQAILEETKDELMRASASSKAAELVKIGEAASSLVYRITEGIEYCERSSQVLNYSKALKDLLDIIRDVNGLQTETEKQSYALAKERLALEREKLHGNVTDECESGVVLLPEVEENA